MVARGAESTLAIGEHQLLQPRQLHQLRRHRPGDLVVEQVNRL